MRILERIICWILGHKYQSLDGSPFWIECTSCGKINMEEFKEKIEPLYRSYLCNICKEPAPMGMWVWGNPRCEKHLHSIDDQKVTVTREKS